MVAHCYGVPGTHVWVVVELSRTVRPVVCIGEPGPPVGIVASAPVRHLAGAR